MKSLLAFIVAASLLVISPPSFADPLPGTTVLKGCYGEAAAAGQFLKAGDRQSAGVVGLGCDVSLDRIIVGGGLRARFGDADAGSLYARLGLAVNANLTVYGITELKSIDWKFKDTRQLQLGLGAETTAFSDQISVFVEGTTSVAKFGPLASRDDVEMMIGLRWRPSNGR